MRIAKIWFLITPATCLSSVFLFLFGVSALSLFLTGNEGFDIYNVLRMLETLPDPREFTNDCFSIYNAIMVHAQGIRNPVVASIVNLFALLVTFVAGAIVFPLYTLSFTFRTFRSILMAFGFNVGPIASWNWADWQLFSWLGGN